MAGLARADRRVHPILRWLVELWENCRSVFGLVSPKEQWYLDDYFVPAWTQATEAEVMAHREQVRVQRPSLPQCAGKAVRKLHRELKAAKARQGTGEPGDRKVVARAVVRPQVDVDRMTRALLRAAEDIRLDPPA